MEPRDQIGSPPPEWAPDTYEVRPSPRSYSPDAMRRAAAEMHDAAERLDRVGDSIPATLHAGPFTPWIADMIEGVVANCAIQVQRMTTLADELEAGASTYEGCDRENVDMLDRVERATYPESLLTGPSPEHGGWGPDAVEEREVLDEEAERKFEDPPPIDHWSSPNPEREVGPDDDQEER